MLAGMGTELQYSPNFFTTMPRSHGNTVTVPFDTQDTRAPPKDRPLRERTRTGPDPPQQSMDRLQCHKETLRKTMLEHEKTFKEQVRELHRLYRTQKLLMSQLQTREPKLHPLPYTTPGAASHPSSGLWSSASSGAQASCSPSAGDRHRHGAAHLSGGQSSRPGHGAKASLSSQELTVCSGEDPGGPAPGAAVATGAGDDQAPPCSNEDCDLELTLSIGCGGKKGAWRRSRSDTPSGCRPESSANSTGLPTPSAMSDPGERADPSEGSERESLQRPAWLLQGLSLNRTR